MKHIKLFEGFKKEDYYTKISEDDYDYGKIVDIDNSLYNKIKSLCKNSKANRIYMAYHIHDGSGVESYGVSIKGGRTAYPKNILITKHEDDYFYVRGEVQDIMSGPYNPSYIYFKCDHIDGLVEFLKDYGFVS